MYVPSGDGTGAVDIGAVVCEIGSYAARLGFAGEDQPRSYFPSHMGVSEGAGMDLGGGQNSGDEKQYTTDLMDGKPGLEVKSPITDGLLEDWDIVERIWKHANATNLQVDLAQTPLLLVERCFNTPKLRQKYAELMFEKFQSPALLLCKDSVLCSFACGKTTALVVDIGAEVTTVAPIQEGWLETKGLMRSSLGGRVMDKHLLELFARSQVTIRPAAAVTRTCIQQPGVGPHWQKSVNVDAINTWTASYRQYTTLEVARDLRESVCRMPEGTFAPADPKYSGVPRMHYELPDGVVVAVGVERFQVPDILMNTEPVKHLLTGDEGEWSRDPLPKMLVESIFRCERDQQAQLISSVVVAGGGACVEGTMDRLKLEVETQLAGQSQGMLNRLKVLQPPPSERKICAWLGGSIVASLGSFHDMWVSKQEYAEHGAGIVDRKCP